MVARQEVVMHSVPCGPNFTVCTPSMTQSFTYHLQRAAEKSGRAGSLHARMENDCARNFEVDYKIDRILHVVEPGH